MNLNPSQRLTAYPYIDKAILLFFCGYVIMWYLQLGDRIEQLGSIRFEFICATILIVLAFSSTPKINLNAPVLGPIVAYFIILVIQIPFSQDFPISWAIFVDRVIKFAFMAFFIIAFVRSPDHLRFFLGAFILACLKMGQEGFIGKISGSMMWENQGVMRLHGPTGLYAHPNSFAGMAIGTIPFVYYLTPISRRVIKIIL